MVDVKKWPMDPINFTANGGVVLDGSSVALSDNIRSGGLPFAWQNDGLVLDPGVAYRLKLPADITIIEWDLSADQIGDVEVGIEIAAVGDYPTFTSITDGNNPELVGAIRGSDSNLSNWDLVNLTDGMYLQATLLSVVDITDLSLTLKVMKVD